MKCEFCDICAHRDVLIFNIRTRRIEGTCSETGKRCKGFKPEKVKE